MSKLSARDLQMILAGVFMFSGLGSLIWLPRTLTYSRDTISVFVDFCTCFALPLGIGIVLGNVRALLLARIVLWLWCFGSAFNVCIAVVRRYHVVSGPPSFSLYRSLSDLALDAALLSVLIWSRSRRFKNEPDP